MAISEAQKRASEKWRKERVDEFKLRMPRGEKAEIQAHAVERGETMNGFVLRAVRETMERDRETDN